jgi:hypothetical protein
MILLSKNNYLRQTTPWSLEYDPLPTKFDNYFVESCRAAEEIYSQKKGKLHLLYSGGVDSEYALSVFLHMGIDITPVIIRLNPNYNTYDIDYAFNFCVSKGLNPVVLDINFDRFVKSGKFLEVSKICRSELYHRAATAYAAGQLDGTVLLGDGEPCIRNIDGVWNVEIYQHDYAVWNYFVAKGIYGTIHFNRYTPEMMMSFFSDKRINDLANNKVPGKLGSNSSKFIIYNRHSNFNLEERPKYHGYETIEKSEIFNHPDFQELAVLGKEWNGVYSKNYFEFMKEVWKQ